MWVVTVACVDDTLCGVVTVVCVDDTLWVVTVACVELVDTVCAVTTHQSHCWSSWCAVTKGDRCVCGTGRTGGGRESQ